MAIKCPNCGHRAITQFGTYLRLKLTYKMAYDNFFSIRFLSPNPRSWPSLADARRYGMLLGFYCLSCNEEYPEGLQEEILPYIRNRMILWKLKEHG